MTDKQRQYIKFQKNLKQAINKVEKYYSAITDLKNNSNTKPPQPQIKLIRKQKIKPFSTLQDQSQHNENKEYHYITHTPKYNSLQQQETDLKAKNLNCDVQSFNIQQSFSNKHNTVKKEYLDYPNRNNKEINIDKEQIYFKQTSKEVQNLKNQEITVQLPKQRPIRQKQSGNGILPLENGWHYKGQYSQGLFHGFGQLYHSNSLVFSGTFQFGYFNGYGKLKYHKDFEYLISKKNLRAKLNKLSKGEYLMSLKTEELSQSLWTAYFGQFSKGTVTGYGELWLSNGEKIASKWFNGKNVGKYCVKKGTEFKTK